MAATLALGAASGAAAGVIAPETGDCAATKANVEISKVESIGDELRVRAKYAVAGEAFGSLLEYRVDSDRYRAEVELQTAGEVDKSFPFSLCGEHVFHFWIYPVVSAGSRHVVCLASGTRAKALFNNSCGNDVRLSEVTWECAPDGACQGKAVVSLGDGKGNYLLMSSVGRAAFRAVADPAPGPFQVSWTCRAGEQIRLRGRAEGAVTYLGAFEGICGKP